MKRNFFLLFASLFLLSFVFPFNSYAVTVGPAKLDYSVNPGNTIEGNFYLKNEEGEDQSFWPSYEKFTEDNGQKKFLKDESDLASWINTETPVVLKAGEAKTVPYTIKIPKNAEPGGHFAVIWWSTAPPASQGSAAVSVVTRAGILLMVRVSGDVREGGQLTNFSTGKSKKIFWSFPVALETTFQNEGNVHLKPTGIIVVKNILGQTKGIVKVNEGLLQILPDSKRSFENIWEGTKFAFGPYKAELTMVFGENQTRETKSFWFFYLPLKIIIAFVAVLLLIFFGLPKMIKKYNQWIVNKARAGPAKSERPAKKTAARKRSVKKNTING